MKNLILRNLFVLIAIGSFTGCGGETLFNPAGTLTGDSKTLSVQTVHYGTADAHGHRPNLTVNGNQRRFTTADGTVITLTRAEIGWGHLRLSTEGSGPDCVAGTQAELHLEQTENLLDADSHALTLAEGEIPDAEYCSYTLELESARVEGTWENGLQTGNFSLEFTGTVTVEGAFAGHPFHFHEGEDSKTLTFGVHYDQWLNAMDLSAGNAAALQATLVENVRSSLHRAQSSAH